MGSILKIQNNINHQIIYKILKRKLWKYATSKFSDSALKEMILFINQSRKLDENDVINIKLDLKANLLTRNEIAKKYKVHKDTISNIFTGRTWSNVKI